MNIPVAIETFLSEYELSVFCIVYDSLSYTFTSLFRLVVRLFTELVLEFPPDENDIINPGDANFILSIPDRFRLCGVESTVDRDESFFLCVAATFLPSIPIFFKAYFATFTSTGRTGNAGIAVEKEPNYLTAEEVDTVSIQSYTEDLISTTANFYDNLSPSEFQSFFDEFQDGLQRLVSYENNQVDKSFASIRVTTGSNPGAEECYFSDKYKSKKSSGGSGSKKSSGSSGSKKTGKSKKSPMSNMSSKMMSENSLVDQCSNDYDAFVSAGVTNSESCDPITEDSLNYLGTFLCFECFSFLS